MPRYRKIAAKAPVADLRQADGNGADVTVEPASTTTNDAPALTKASVAPESSPAQTKSSGAKAPKKSAAKAKS